MKEGSRTECGRETKGIEHSCKTITRLGKYLLCEIVVIVDEKCRIGVVECRAVEMEKYATMLGCWEGDG